VLRVEQGSLYPALHRLIKRGWIDFDHGTSENNRRAKYYRLTAAGKRQLEQHRERWNRATFAVTCVLEGA
jgi:PadR family transcriptional regulator, regulatory protein PadR